MTTAVQPESGARYDVRTIVAGGVTLGVITAIGVAAFALLSRAMAGGFETAVQSVLVLAGGAVFAYVPAVCVRPRDADSIAWAALVGLLGALVFTVIDTALLRPLDLYHWTWDRIGGGSGFWYVPVWWMGSAVLAWLGAWIFAVVSRGEGAVSVPATAGTTIGITVVLLALLVLTGIGPFHPAMAALAFGLALVVHVPLASMLARR
jgi:hypothetical protein